MDTEVPNLIGMKLETDKQIHRQTARQVIDKLMSIGEEKENEALGKSPYLRTPKGKTVMVPNQEDSTKSLIVHIKHWPFIYKIPSL